MVIITIGMNLTNADALLLQAGWKKTDTYTGIDGISSCHYKKGNLSFSYYFYAGDNRIYELTVQAL